ncbi:MAG TPA: 5'/3'-nucleotidase SurE [Alphaproteobacteria bacterium]|jgi:5'-nucleotidase|nr:5'/3'-nucleotidase SurE [Alphaproteobacteria bacterium]
MTKGPIDLSKARILISNDDGIHATGLKLLEEVALTLCDDVWVVAPEAEQSGASHSLTMRRPLRMRTVSERHYAVDGTPTDAVLLAVQHVLKDRRPDLVLSGINRGANLGEDVTYSGTCAAAMEGTLLGIPSIALSQHADGRSPTKWATAERYAPDVIARLASMRWPADMFVNVNFPDVAAASVRGIHVVPQGRRKPAGSIEERIDPRGTPYYWIGLNRDVDPMLEETDVASVRDGFVSVTPINLDMTFGPVVERLRKAFA